MAHKCNNRYTKSRETHACTQMNHVNIRLIANTMFKMSHATYPQAHDPVRPCHWHLANTNLCETANILCWAGSDSWCIIWLVLQHSSIIQCTTFPRNKDFLRMLVKLKLLTLLLCHRVGILTVWCTLYLCGPLEHGSWVQILWNSLQNHEVSLCSLSYMSWNEHFKWWINIFYPTNYLHFNQENKMDLQWLSQYKR